MPPDLRRPYQGVPPREEPILDWRPSTARVQDEQRRARRAFIHRILRDTGVRSITEMHRHVEAHFGSAPTTATVQRDMLVVGGARLVMPGGRYAWRLTGGDSPDTLAMELRDRFVMDVLRVQRVERTLVIETSHRLAPAVHELVKLASAERLLPGYLHALHDGDDVVVVTCRDTEIAHQWRERCAGLLLGRKAHLDARPEAEG